MIKDSRQLYGVNAPTAEEVRAAWAAYAAEKIAAGQFPFSADPGVMSFRKSNKRLKAYVNEGRWIADCPRCNGGVAVWVGMPDAACYDCGRVFSDIRFPSADKILKAERLLMKRPSSMNMNWDPDLQTIANLKEENLLHGYDFSDTPSQYEEVDDIEEYVPPTVPTTPTDDIVPPGPPPIVVTP